MILGNKELRNRYKDTYDDEMFTSNGIDYRLHDVKVIDNHTASPGITKKGKKLPLTRDVESLEKADGSDDLYFFKAGEYYLWDLGYHELLDDCITLFYIRSTLMRGGGQIISSVGDKGFHGHIIVGFKCHTDMIISKGERVVQAVFYKTDKDDVLYDGDYNE